MMLRQEKTGTDSLLEKYDNSALLPVDAERLTDYGVDNTITITTAKIVMILLFCKNR